MARLFTALASILILVGTPAKADDFERGIEAMRNGNYERGQVLLLPLAQKGHASAQSVLGGLYATGRVAGLDGKVILDWLKNIAEGNTLHPAIRGKGKFSKSRFPREAYYIGAIHMQGIGVPSDFAEALPWLRASADGGFPPSFILLGQLFKFGQSEKRSEDGKKVLREGVVQDDVLAYMWLSIASLYKNLGDDQALSELKVSMDEDDKAEGARLAKEWVRNHRAIRNAIKGQIRQNR